MSKSTKYRPTKYGIYMHAPIVDRSETENDCVEGEDLQKLFNLLSHIEEDPFLPIKMHDKIKLLVAELEDAIDATDGELLPSMAPSKLYADWSYVLVNWQKWIRNVKAFTEEVNELFKREKFIFPAITYKEDQTEYRDHKAP